MRQNLEARLKALTDITIAPWKDSDLVCVNFKGREVAHFQTEDETVLDIRLSPKIIAEERLDRTVSAQFHPKRSKNSRWICVRCCAAPDIDKIVHLVERACAERL
ncbi:MAG: luciferase family protein [Pseudomonadota bacterium]